MENLIIVFATFIPALALMFVEGMLRVNWVKHYYSFGIKIYERSFTKDRKTLIDLYADLNKIRETDQAGVMIRLTDDNDSIFFRNKYDNKLYGNFSLLHGAIKMKNDSFGIAGYIGLTEVFYICFIPYLLGYYYLISNQWIVIPMIILVFLGNAVYYFANFFRTKKFLDGI